MAEVVFATTLCLGKSSHWGIPTLAHDFEDHQNSYRKVAGRRCFGHLVRLSEFCQEGPSHGGKKKASQQESVWAANIRWAKRAVEVGQYLKGIQALTSNGLATPSADILANMLAKHQQTPFFPSPSHPAPPPANIMDEVVLTVVLKIHSTIQMAVQIQ